MTVIAIQPPDGIFHHEDLPAGTQLTFGHRLVTREEIIAFATAYDPQPIHLDEDAAKASIVGGLCASGFHSCSIMMRLLCDHFLLRAASLGSPGLDEALWLKPVRPGDILSVRITVLEARNLQSRPDVGLSKMLFEVLNQNGDTALNVTTNQLMRRRRPGPPVEASARDSKPVRVAEQNLWDGPAQSGAPRHGNYFEDQVVGEVQDLGGHTFGRDEIIAFAKQFDPQPFHLDEEAGKRSLFGGLSASGWLTAAVFIRQVVRARHGHEAAMRAVGQAIAEWGPSPGFRNLQWLRPVLVGDRIDFRNAVVEARPLKSRPNRGLVIFQAEGRNQRREIVYRFTGQVFVERRHPASL